VRLRGLGGQGATDIYGEDSFLGLQEDREMEQDAVGYFFFSFP
jgi:hypothetical protein